MSRAAKHPALFIGGPLHDRVLPVELGEIVHANAASGRISYAGNPVLDAEVTAIEAAGVVLVAYELVKFALRPRTVLALYKPLGMPLTEVAETALPLLLSDTAKLVIVR